MSDFDPNNPSDSDGDDLGGLAWNEFDWERYLREQDDVIHRYLGFYELLSDDPERIDKVAQCMGWSEDAEDGSDEDGDDEDDDDGDFGDEPYTVHKNYIFVATKALYQELTRGWARIAEDATRVPQPLAIAFQASLHQGEDCAMMAIHALDFGDYAMAVSLFKRALGELNHTLALLDEKAAGHSRALADYRERALVRLFDLREVWLRMTRECRVQIDRSKDTRGDED